MFLIIKKHGDYGTGIEVHVIQSVARCLLPDILKFYESEEGQKYYKEWKNKQEQTENRIKA